MLVELKISNFRSFKDEVVFSMEPLSLNGKNKKEARKNLAETSFSKIPYVYKTSGIFGPNASGKTNVIMAAIYLKYVVSRGSVFSKDDKFPDERYKFSKEYSKKPTCLNLKFIKNFRLYEYEICLTDEKVIYERAFYSDFSKTGSKKKNRVFSRELCEDNSYEFSLSKGLKKTWCKELLPQRVFLSDMVNNRGADKKEVLDIYDFIERDIYITNTNSEVSYFNVMGKMEKDDEVRKKIVDFTKTADLGLYDITVKRKSKEEFFRSMPFSEKLDQNKKDELFNKISPINAMSHHKTEDGNIVEMDFDDESDGTKTYLSFSYAVLSALKQGTVLFIDELDASLHPYLVKNLVNMFNNSDTGSQLIFTSHAHYLMDGKALTRDQIWFTSKENGYYTDLFPLSDFDEERTRTDFYKSYMRGIYGAVPRVTEL